MPLTREYRVRNKRPNYIIPLIAFATLAICPTRVNAQTHDDVCEVVQAAFVTLTKSQYPVYPRDIEASSGSLVLEGIRSSSFAKIELREDELSDLISQQTKYSKRRGAEDSDSVEARVKAALATVDANHGSSADELPRHHDQGPQSQRDHFLPECDWKGQALALGTGTTSVKFSSPIFSSNSQLAVMSVSFVPSSRYGRPMWGGHEEMCILRKVDSGWRAQCLPTWIQ
jgi:hypothetical protein